MNGLRRDDVTAGASLSTSGGALRSLECSRLSVLYFGGV